MKAAKKYRTILEVNSSPVRLDLNDKNIKKAIKLGITKINVNTELRMVWRDGLKQSLKSSEYAPYSLLNKSRSNVESRVKEKLLIFW